MRTPVLSSRTISERAAGTRLPEGREPPAHRVVQAARRRWPSSTRSARTAAARASSARARATTPRPSPTRRASAACAARSSSPRTRRSPRSRPPRRWAPSSTAAARASRSAWPRRAPAPTRAWPTSTRSTTPTWSPGRGRSGSSCSTRCPTWPGSSCPSGAAGWRAGSPSPCARRGPRSRWWAVGAADAMRGAADDRRRHRGQAARGRVTGPLLDEWLSDARRGRRGRGRRGDGAAARAGQARRRGRGRGRPWRR